MALFENAVKSKILFYKKKTIYLSEEKVQMYINTINLQVEQMMFTKNTKS